MGYYIDKRLNDKERVGINPYSSTEIVDGVQKFPSAYYEMLERFKLHPTEETEDVRLMMKLSKAKHLMIQLNLAFKDYDVSFMYNSCFNKHDTGELCCYNIPVTYTEELISIVKFLVEPR